MTVPNRRSAPGIWLEPVVALSIGIGIEICNALFFQLAGGWLLGVAVAVGGFLLAVQRHAIQTHISDQVSALSASHEQSNTQIQKIGAYVDLSTRAGYDSVLSTLVTRYGSITEPEFEPVKRQLVEGVVEGLHSLAAYKRSTTLHTADYYDWLFRQFGSLKEGEYIHAVSLSSDDEWNDSELERNFLRVNIEAGKRGVEVTRLFIVESSRIKQFVQLPPIQHHTVESETPLTGYWVKREELQKYDANLLKRVNEGFIDFNGRVGLEDRFDPAGEARGDVTMLPQDIKRMQGIYTQLLNLATPLSIAASSAIQNETS